MGSKKLVGWGAGLSPVSGRAMGWSQTPLLVLGVGGRPPPAEQGKFLVPGTLSAPGGGRSRNLGNSPAPVQNQSHSHLSPPVCTPPGHFMCDKLGSSEGVDHCQSSVVTFFPPVKKGCISKPFWEEKFHPVAMTGAAGSQTFFASIQGGGAGLWRQSAHGTRGEGVGEAWGSSSSGSVPGWSGASPMASSGILAPGNGSRAAGLNSDLGSHTSRQKWRPVL